MTEGKLLWAPLAWLPGGWHPSVLLECDPSGLWSSVEADTAPPPQAERLAGPALPGLVNAHSHAFQRAFAGLAERRTHAHDDFWSWRQRMYQVAERLEPPLLHAIAAQVYVELLRGGYTHVCEFHYVQHRPDGSPYPDPLAMSWALLMAATETGMPITVLPTLYERAGFDRPNLESSQRRFAMSAQQVWNCRAAIESQHFPNVRTGLAIHSLRAAAPESVTRLLQLADEFEGPIHIHVAEQKDEVTACRNALGSAPIEWLAKRGIGFDRRWQLVHATHATADEIELAADAGAGVVLCPSTEANLGDGLADAPAWLATGAPFSVGSDSHVTRDWREEVRWLEYGQRLASGHRNIGAAPAQGEPSTAGRWLMRLIRGSAAAAGFDRWGLEVGARADLLVIDRAEPALIGIPDTQLLDALIFSSPSRPWRDVMVAGGWRIKQNRHTLDDQVAARFEKAMQQLWT